MQKSLTEVLETGTPADFPIEDGMLDIQDWTQAQEIWKKFKESLAENLARDEFLPQGDTAIADAVQDCVVSAIRTVHGNLCIFVGSKGADPGPEVYCWMENGELRAEENVEYDSDSYDVEPQLD